MSEQILLSGVPGTGKTTVAEHIETAHGFTHVDMEADGFNTRDRYYANKTAFLGSLATERSVLISWGFGPHEDLEAVEELVETGYRPVWLDGNRVASFRSFMDREQHDPASELAYYGQLKAIMEVDVIGRLNPRIVNPFDEQGDFRSAIAIATDILQLESPEH